MKALAIHPDNTYHGVDSHDYEDISNVVGGFIQIVPRNCVGKDLTMYVNEEGKMMGLELNVLASKLVGKENFLPGDFISGSMYVTGPINGEGEETPLSDEDFRFLRAWLDARGGEESPVTF